MIHGLFSTESSKTIGLLDKVGAKRYLSRSVDDCLDASFSDQSQTGSIDHHDIF